MADLELELAQLSFSSAIRGHHVYLATHLHMHIATVHMNIIKCGYCSRAATIMLSSCSVQRLFEGGVYLGCGVYSRKYGIYLDPSYHAFSISPPSRPQCNGKMCILLCCWGEHVSTSVRQAGQWAANCCVTCCRAVHVTEVSTALGHVGE